jgi:hypothetical protein
MRSLASHLSPTARDAGSAIVLLSVAACCLVLWAPDEAVRAIGGLPLALLLPGLAAARFRRSHDLAEHLALSVGLSVVAAILSGLFLVSVGAFSSRAIALMLGALAVALVVVPAALSPLPGLERVRLERVRRPLPARGAIAAMLGVLLIFGGAIAWSVHSENASAAKATTSALSAYDRGGRLTVGVTLVPADRKAASVRVNSGANVLLSDKIVAGLPQWGTSLRTSAKRIRITLTVDGHVLRTILLLPPPTTVPGAAAAAT